MGQEHRVVAFLGGYRCSLCKETAEYAWDIKHITPEERLKRDIAAAKTRAEKNKRIDTCEQ
jgi:hypothetical protein